MIRGNSRYFCNIQQSLKSPSKTLWRIIFVIRGRGNSKVPKTVRIFRFEIQFRYTLKLKNTFPGPERFCENLSLSKEGNMSKIGVLNLGDVTKNTIFHFCAFDDVTPNLLGGF